jgi:hypothetical protein
VISVLAALFGPAKGHTSLRHVHHLDQLNYPLRVVVGEEIVQIVIGSFIERMFPERLLLECCLDRLMNC